MHTGIIGVKEELDHLLMKLEKTEKKEYAGMVLYCGKLHGRQVSLIQSGIGKVNAALSAFFLIEKAGVSHIINTGSAGGLSEEQTPEDLVIAQNLVYHDVDARVFGYQPGQVPGMPATYPCNPRLYQLAIEQGSRLARKEGISLFQGQIATGDSFMDNPEKVQQIQKQFPEALAVEMEGAAIAQTCHNCNIPCLVIRSLSDIAGQESHQSYELFLKKASRRSAELAENIVKEYRQL